MGLMAVLMWCKLNHCVADIVWLDGRPICFLSGENGEVCQELDDNFIELCSPARR